MTQSKIYLLLLFITTCMISCQQPASAPKPVDYPQWVKNSVFYEVNTRQHTASGTFNAFEKDLPRLKELGVDVLWFMPIYPIGELRRKLQEGSSNSLGSYYSVRDYKAINPEFGTREDFKSLVNKAHEMGFKVILDWVANHTAWDNKWITEHPDWYKKSSKGEIATPFDWTDCAQLDYSNMALRREMIESMKYWITDYNIDGFRCDMAGLVPTDFWEEARAQLQKIKPLFMLAENEDKNELCKIAFDSNYGWEMHHLMSAVTKGKKEANAIGLLQLKIDSLLPSRSFKLNFVTNHDENSWNGTAREKYGNGEKACTILTYTLPGAPLIYSGQEASLNKRLRFFSKDTINWSDTTLVKFYKTLNALKHRSSALNAPPYGGKFVILANKASDKILSFARIADQSKVVVLLNLSDKSVTTKITDSEADGAYINAFNGNKIILDDDNRNCYFEPWEFIVLQSIDK